VVAGGSLGGLSSALALRCVNCEVQVFERSSDIMRSRGAGLVVQMELINFLKEHSIATEEAISVPAYKRQYLQLMTSWDTIYRQLRYLICISAANDFMGYYIQAAKECSTR
jgi:2-polyprenyl-6-methoxyphenol hydroxylase-like FAD-dependent oxidoreductase